MKKIVRFSFTIIFLTVLCCSHLLSQTIEDEIAGIDNSQPTVTNSGSERGTNDIPAGGLLLIPESSNDRVMAFDPTTGDLINADFIPSDPTNLQTPIQAILNNDGTGFLVSDQLNDVVQEYDLDGNYVGVFAPAGGVNINIINNPRGICLRPNGNLLVTLGSTANAGSAIEFDTDGNYQGVFLPGQGTSSFDVIRLADDSYMMGDINASAIYRYDASGSYTSTLTSIDDFPEQLHQTSTGNILVGNWSGTEEGVVEYTIGGSQVGIYDPASLGGYRGAYELPNGNILTTNSNGVHEIDRNGNLVETKISGVSARFITYVENTESVPVSPWVIPLIILAIVLTLLISYRIYYKRIKKV
ncbi:MAG: hypothetical protein K9G67_13020 [Bacteroidales bacterium]|nr:hypothetical protein [Bacteroidales bacterium]MCF8343190.1 hypothetical protein [Bacteroidales bacterium]MCF8351803.1 hypothetical protein [Bacteroidales bacterium]MCF8377273.1 hypothetical protein [Bacteroidales bacterium]MCF8401105.1 hypothetical protein [Bacteroidales bacterium]